MITLDDFKTVIDLKGTCDTAKASKAIYTEIQPDIQQATPENPLIILFATSINDNLIPLKQNFTQEIQNQNQNLVFSLGCDETKTNDWFTNFPKFQKNPFNSIRLPESQNFMRNANIIDAVSEHLRNDKKSLHIQFCNSSQANGKNNLPYKQSLHYLFNEKSFENIISIYVEHDSFDITQIPNEAIFQLNNALYIKGVKPNKQKKIFTAIVPFTPAPLKRIDTRIASRMLNP
jgi:hypothetical protein